MHIIGLLSVIGMTLCMWIMAAGMFWQGEAHTIAAGTLFVILGAMFLGLASEPLEDLGWKKRRY